MRRAVELLLRGAIHRTVVMPCKTTDGCRCEHVRFNHVSTKVRHETNGGVHRTIEPTQLLKIVLFAGQSLPPIKIRNRCNADHTVRQIILPLAIVEVSIQEIVGGADDSGADVAEFLTSFPMKPLGIVKKNDGRRSGCNWGPASPADGVCDRTDESRLGRRWCPEHRPGP